MNKRYQEDFLMAGKIAQQVRVFGKSLIKKGASYNAVYSQIQKKITELGGRPAFPPQMALNHVAAHFLPSPGEDILFSDQVVKLDIGVCYKGAIGDCAVTVDLSGRHQALVDAVEAALLAAEQSIEVGLPLRQIGKIIEKIIASRGFSSIKNLGGHGLGLYQVHTAPLVPNYDDRSMAVVMPGMTFAIEPFATDGKGFTREEGAATIFSLVKTGPLRSPKTRQLLEKIQKFRGLPFAIHDLIEGKNSLEEVEQGLSELLLAGMLDGYPPLVEAPHCCVVQAENSVLVDEKGKVFISTR